MARAGGRCCVLFDEDMVLLKGVPGAVQFAKSYPIFNQKRDNEKQVGAVGTDKGVNFNAKWVLPLFW